MTAPTTSKTAELPPLPEATSDPRFVSTPYTGDDMHAYALAAIAAREATHAAHAGGVEEWDGELRPSSLKARTAKGIVQQVYRRHHGPMERHECEELIRLIDALDSTPPQAVHPGERDALELARECIDFMVSVETSERALTIQRKALAAIDAALGKTHG